MTKDHQTDTDALVERLEDSKGWPTLGKAAAARIKALSAELSETKKDVTDMEPRALKAESENARLRDVLIDLVTIHERIMHDPHWRTNDNTLWPDACEAGEKARAALEEKTDD